MRQAVVTAAAALILLAVPSIAAAEEFMGEGHAQRFARHAANHRYPVYNLYADCDPFGPGGKEAGYIYRRWSCVWVGEHEYRDQACGGLIRIVGRPGTGRYAYRITNGMICWTP